MGVRRTIRWAFSRTERGREIYLFHKLSDYLEKVGWFRSDKERMPVDKDGNPLPWLTYPFITFMRGRVRPDMAVFEYGSGNSTLWWSKQVARVISCENDKKWYNGMLDKIPSNVEYKYCELVPGGDYCKMLLAYEKQFDIVFIDGDDRVNCAKNALGALKDDGVIIWDNSELVKYQAGYDYLINNGFRRLDFGGLGPLINIDWCTSVFYRDNNCLGI